MNTQHTPGPWNWKGDVLFAEFTTILEAHWWNAVPGDRAMIAAAPELLAVAKRCLAMVEEGVGPPNWDWIREVIAKATTP
jgi:hypothetical protein